MQNPSTPSTELNTSISNIIIVSTGILVASALALTGLGLGHGIANLFASPKPESASHSSAHQIQPPSAIKEVSSQSK